MSNSSSGVNSLKYNELIAKEGLKGTCPEGDAQGRDTNAYRWINGDPLDNDNYLPTMLWYLKKKIPLPPPRTPDFHCKKCSLSLFTTKGAAEGVYNNLNDNIRKKFGYTHVAYASLCSRDGLASTPSGNGHFSFFEYSVCNLANKFVVVSPF